MPKTKQAFGRALNRPKQIPTDQLIEMWEDDKDGEYIQVDDDAVARYIAHGRAMEIIPRKNGNLFAGIREWMEENQFYPNIWQINERGNCELLDLKGRGLGGLV